MSRDTASVPLLFYYRFYDFSAVLNHVLCPEAIKLQVHNSVKRNDGTSFKKTFWNLVIVVQAADPWRLLIIF